MQSVSDMGIKYLIGIMAILSGTPAFSQESAVKCGTGRYIPGFLDSKVTEEMISTSRPVLHRSEMSPSGKFRIHFDTIGVNVPVMRDASGNVVPNTTYRSFVDTLKVIADSVWNAEVETFGFRAPVPDAGRGGGDEYDIYIVDLGGGWFGETVPEYDFPLVPGKTNQQYSSFMRVENDFGIGYRTKGINALKVTIAHEFQHAIQVSGTGLWMSDFYFYELSAEAFEPVVFPDVKDYINDVKIYFTNISSIPLFSKIYPGYERAIFGVYLIRRFGTDIMVNLWEEMRSAQPIPALQKSLQQKATTVEKEFAEFADWIYFTESRADSVNYFPDARIFPPLTFYQNIVADNSVQLIQGSAKSFSTQFIKATHGSDSTHFVLTNVDIDDALAVRNADYLYQLRLSTGPSSGLTEVRPDLFADFDPIPDTDSKYWKYRVQTSRGPYLSIPLTSFPNPYEPAKGLMYFNVDMNLSPAPQLYIYSISMDLVYSGEAKTSLYSGKLFPVWNGRDNQNNTPGSGIYYYFLTDNSKTVNGKFAILR
ncbi:MAG: MXAN_6640 family putative metalloprotease [Bacteroidota bacterium]